MPFLSPSASANNWTQNNAGVFHRVVLIHVQVAIGVKLQIEAAVFAKKLEHVIEEAHARRNPANGRGPQSSTRP